MLQAELKDAGRRTIFSGATPLRSWRHCAHCSTLTLIV
jgi:hypothetical protein